MRLDRTALALAVAAALALPPAVMAQQAPKPESKPAQAKDQNKGGLASGDRRFVMDAAHGNTAEVELGKLAAEKGSSDAVKQFGKRMTDDHAKANAELKEFAEKKGLTLPADLDPKHRQLRDRLAKLNGADFDRAYANEMVNDHKKDVAEFKREAKSAKDPDLKAWASKTLPTLEDHLKQAQDMQTQVKSAPRAAR
jgi:putative membrane protein